MYTRYSFGVLNIQCDIFFSMLNDAIMPNSEKKAIVVIVPKIIAKKISNIRLFIIYLLPNAEFSGLSAVMFLLNYLCHIDKIKPYYIFFNYC